MNKSITIQTFRVIKSKTKHTKSSRKLIMKSNIYQENYKPDSTKLDSINPYQQQQIEHDVDDTHSRGNPTANKFIDPLLTQQTYRRQGNSEQFTQQLQKSLLLLQRLKQMSTTKNHRPIKPKQVITRISNKQKDKFKNIDKTVQADINMIGIVLSGLMEKYSQDQEKLRILGNIKMQLKAFWNSFSES